MASKGKKTNLDIGAYLWQNQKKIALEKERDCLSVYLYNDNSLELIKKIDGVLHVKHVFNEVYRLKVDESKLELIMHTLREGLSLVCHHAYKPANTHFTRYYLTDRITVSFKRNIGVAYIEKMMKEYGLRYVRTYGKKVYLLQVTASSKRNPIKIANELAERNAVRYAEPNLISRYTPSAFIPADEKFPEQWHLHSEPAPELAPGADIQAAEAWDITMGDRKIVVAVLDDGFDLSHPDLQGPGKVVFPRDFVDGNHNPTPGPNDFHGTPCAGVAIAEANGVGVVGVAPNCAFMPVRIPFGADPDLLYDIFDYVGKYADVISCSWGPPPVYAPLHQLVYDKIKELTQKGGPRGKGCVIIFAAHNYNAPLKDLKNQGGVEYIAGDRIYRHTDPIWNGDATHPDIITVAASTSLNTKAAYSNWGKEITICAPSNNYHPLDYSVKLPGRGVCTTDNFKVGQNFSPNNRYTTQFGGTSSAAPVVAGVAALVLSINPHLSAKQVRAVLVETTDKILDADKDILLGHNKGSYDKDGHSEWFGHGKVNALRAVQKAVELLPCDEDGQAIFPTAPSAEKYKQLDNVIPVVMQGNVTGELDHKGDLKVYQLHLGGNLTIEMSSQLKSADYDLYLKKDEIPNENNYDARAISDNSNEQIQFNNLEAGTYYLMVRAFNGKGKFSIHIKVE